MKNKTALLKVLLVKIQNNHQKLRTLYAWRRFKMWENSRKPFCGLHFFEDDHGHISNIHSEITHLTNQAGIIIDSVKRPKPEILNIKKQIIDINCKVFNLNPDITFY